MYNLHVRPCRELRNNYHELTKIIKEHDHVVITNGGKGEAVLLSFEDYAEYEEYLHMKYVGGKLAEAEERAKGPNAVWYSEEEFYKRAGSDL